MNKYKIGYTQGTFDLFHIGHLNLLENAKKQCEYLVVGVNSDDLVYRYKNKLTKTKQLDRVRIINSLKFVDEVFIADTLNKEDMYKKLKFDVIFIGDDWRGNERWLKTEMNLKKYNVPVIYLPHTDGISTTILKKNFEENMEVEKIDE